MAKNRQRAQQKPPPGIVWIADYTDPQTGVVTPGIASRVGITPSTYRKWRMGSRGPDTFRLGKLVAARIEVVDAWIQGLEQTAQDEQQADQDAAEHECRPPEPRTTRKHTAGSPVTAAA